MSNILLDADHIGLDGKDHINIAMKAETRLGKMLHESYRHNFNVIGYGEFSTLEGYICWLRTGRNDNLYRTLSFSGVIKRFSESKDKLTQLDNFHLHLKLGMLELIQRNPHLAKLLKESGDTPLYNYRKRVGTDDLIMNSSKKMTIDMWGNIRYKLQQGEDLLDDIMALFNLLNV